MAFHVRDSETDELVREFARERAVGLTEAVKLAVTEARAAKARERELVLAAMRRIQDDYARLPKTGLLADKAFYDSLSDEED